MNRQLVCSLFLWFLTLLVTTEAFASAPRLLRSTPEDGAKDVSVHQGRIVLYFDQNMKMNSWSLVQTPSHPFPPMKPLEEPWIDPLTFELEIKELQPDTTYAVQLNSKKRKGFTSSETQTTLPITTITFSTGSEQPKLGINEDTNKDVPPEDNLPPQNIVTNPNKTGPLPGWKLEVTRSTGLQGTEVYQNGFQEPFRYFQKIMFVQEITQANNGWIQEANRTIQSAQLHSLDTQSGQMVPQDLVPAGSDFRVQHSLQGSTLIDANSGQQIWDEDIIAALAPSVQPKLWPEGGELKVGQKWSYQGAELKNRIGLLEVLGGKIDLAVEKIESEPSTGIPTAFIRGKLTTKVDLDAIVLDFDAQVSIDLPIDLNIPFMVKFEGSLSGSGSVMDEMGQQVSYRIVAQGTLLQITKPSKDILENHGNDNVIIEKGKIGPNGQIIAPVEDNSGLQESQSNKRQPVYRYRLYEDTTEKAFTVMVPEGWRTEGGIMSVAPNQIRTVVDGCGKKLHFSMYDPKTQASITYYPTEIYGTTGPSTTFFQIQPGQVLNGMIQMPQLLSPSSYVQQIVFPQARQQASNIQWGKVKSLQSLAAAWKKAFHSEDPVSPNIVAESIEVAYDRNGTRFAELWTALVTSITVNNTTIWMPDFAVVASAPLDIVEEVSPLLKAVITSFRMNPAWMAQTIANYETCTKGVAITQEKIRAIDRKISQQIRKVQKQIHDIDNDIVANRNKTRSVIQEHEHNTLMGEDKYEDTKTGTRYLIDVGYERNFTDGENIIQTNDWNFEPPVGYRDMKNIQITDE